MLFSALKYHNFTEMTHYQFILSGYLEPATLTIICHILTVSEKRLNATIQR